MNWLQLLCVIVKITAAEEFFETQQRLINDLLKRHDPRLAPIPNNTSPLVMNITLMYPKLLELDSNDQSFSMIIEILLTWYDPTLTWNSTNYADVEALVVPRKSFWSPDIGIVNSKQIADTLPTYKQYMRLSPDGVTNYYEAMIATIQCTLDIRLFPFDSQHCQIVFMAYSKTSSELKIQIFLLDYYQYPIENDEWMVTNLSTGFSSLTTLNFTIDEPYYLISFKRRPIFYIAVIIVPTFLLANICVLGLFGPKPDSDIGPEKVPLSLATLMSMTVLLSIVASAMPHNAFPVLGYYILVEIGISALAAIVSVLISFFRGVKQLTKRQENAKESRQDKKYFDLVQAVTWSKTKNEVLFDYVFTAFGIIYNRIDGLMTKNENRMDTQSLEEFEKKGWSRTALKINIVLSIVFTLANFAALAYILQYWH